MFSAKRIESFEYIRVEEMQAFVSRLYELSRKPIILVEQLFHLTLSFICKIVLGNNYFGVSGDDQIVSNSIVSLQEFQEIINEFFFLNGVFNIGDWIPWLDFLDLQGYKKRMNALKKKLDRFHDHLAEDPDLDVKLTYDHLRGFTVEDSCEENKFWVVSIWRWEDDVPWLQPWIKDDSIELRNLLRGFDWKLPDDTKAENLSMEEAYGLTTPRKFPLVAVMEPRLPLHLCKI
ncbi:trimethyltridecatetraene synthase-like [Hibiscus syriacus]|uniref:trimethyltridecatetraene synthase-like n=1 Tax=Hibiscus syriacus TaxID=106335 RepID=UPI001921E7D7|nr:trimethyltridecatetraene synthase-like [Hibiscus syriacus]